jgi:hypothetical protein
MRVVLIERTKQHGGDEVEPHTPLVRIHLGAPAGTDLNAVAAKARRRLPTRPHKEVDQSIWRPGLAGAASQHESERQTGPAQAPCTLR